ncbi:MAG TPA: TonB-dependent receptor [Noviherbaspirillum sp.]
MTSRFPPAARRIAGVLIASVTCIDVQAQERTLPAVEVTANRVQQRLFDSPSVDGVELDWRTSARPAVSMSEALTGIPGIAVRERQNLAQDVQLSIRGFGSRATFGTRGSRLLVDGIPASTPDGQGQASTVSMASARRVEVVRGPWAQMYGNVGGGVMLVETAPAPEQTETDMRVVLGSRGFRQAMLSSGGQLGSGLGVQADVSAFSTEGAREHASARRRYLDMRIDWRADADTSLRVGINGFSQPRAQDPLGLTQAEFQRDPHGVNPLALQFDTRKTVEQYQIGAYGEHRIGKRDRLAFSGYAGQRQVRQFLAFSGAAASSSGGVVDLDRMYYGGSAAWHRAFRTSDRIPVRWSVGTEIEATRDRRLGFVNLNGSQGDLRRDEDNDATAFGLYAQAGAYVDPALLLSAGARYSRVEMRVADRHVTTVSPDDSGRTSYSRFSPVAGVLWHATETLNAFANVGYGFETPTLSELAYRPAGSGFHFALRPARSRHSEAGLKHLHDRVALQATLFHSITDGEIVPLSNQGGRTVFRNVDGVERYGLEAGGKVTSGAVDWTLAYTFLQARFTEGFTGADGRPVNAGNRLPGTARHTLHLEGNWKLSEATRVGLTMRAESRVEANDVNSEAAPGYGTLGLHAERSFRLGSAPASAFLRIDNLFDRDYIGSVIVNESNRRYYEPAAGRALFAGVRIAL